MPPSDSSQLPGLLREGKGGDIERERQVPALPWGAVLKLSRAPVLGVQWTSLFVCPEPSPPH